MPSFDLTSNLDMGEMKNAIDQATREIGGRYDFKGSKITLELKGQELHLVAEDEYKLRAAIDILYSKMAKRNIGLKCIEAGDVSPSGNQMFKQTLNLKSGIDKDQGKKINKAIKASGIKVTSSYLDEKIRVTGKKIDDLQQVFQMLKGHDDVEVELQMDNMKK